MILSEMDTCPPQSRREARRESRREAILDVAERSFREHGYAGTTMSAIAAELGGSKGTLWSYFPSKEALFDAVLDRATAEFREALTLNLSSDDPIETILARLCEQFLTKVVSAEAISLHRLVIGEAARFPEIGRIFYERAPRGTHLLVAGYLEHAMAAGTLHQDDPLRAAQYLTALCMAGSHQQLAAGVIAPPDPAALRREAAQAVAMFLRAYRPDPA
jgi:AcrR family transcriptional regulator